MLIPVILAGGVGTRLWPVSRELFPKQCIRLNDPDWSLLQTTIKRLEGVADLDHCIVVCNEEHRFLVAEQLSQLGLKEPNIILEPEGKNTAPAIALAAFQAKQLFTNPNLLVLPSDHYIKDIKAFHEAIQEAESLSETEQLVTFGVQPTRPETGYGYIKAQINSKSGPVQQFVEKPDQTTAESYLSSGDYFWNSGMFMFQTDIYLDELHRLQPQIHSFCERAITNAQKDLDFTRVDAESFKQSPSDSIDYAIMEKTSKAVVVAYTGDWSDVGSWSALDELADKDNNGNAITGDVLTVDSQDNFVRADDALVALVGVDNLIVVQTPDAVLVSDKSRSQDVKTIVNQLKQNPERSEHQHHVIVHRPWGTYQTVDLGERYQVKRIIVHPGQKLSVQMHHHRAEHWIVVSGTAKVTNGDKDYFVSENESTYIPIGQVHALENPGKIPLELIEVQSGSYLGEDDIIRFNDRYGRS